MHKTGDMVMDMPERIWAKGHDGFEPYAGTWLDESDGDDMAEYVRADVTNAERDAAFTLGVEASHYVARTSTGKIASEIDDLRTMTPMKAALALPEVRELVEALRAAKEQLARVHQDAFAQCAGLALVRSDGVAFSHMQLNMCDVAADKADAVLAKLEAAK